MKDKPIIDYFYEWKKGKITKDEYISIINSIPEDNLPKRPSIREDLRIEELISIGENFISSIIKRDYRSGDDVHFLYEDFLRTLYGNDIFEYLNQFDSYE